MGGFKMWYGDDLICFAGRCGGMGEGGAERWGNLLTFRVEFLVFIMNVHDD